MVRLSSSIRHCSWELKQAPSVNPLIFCFTFSRFKVTKIILLYPFWQYHTPSDQKCVNTPRKYVHTCTLHPHTECVISGPWAFLCCCNSLHSAGRVFHKILAQTSGCGDFLPLKKAYSNRSVIFQILFLASIANHSNFLLSAISVHGNYSMVTARERGDC